MDDEHTPRPDDHLVEPMYEALRESAPGPDPEPGPEPEPGRGCLGLLLLGCALVGLMAAVPAAARGWAVEDVDEPEFYGSEGHDPGGAHRTHAMPPSSQENSGL